MTLPIFDPDFDDYPKLYRQIGLQVVPSYQPNEVRDWKRPKLNSWREHENELVSDGKFNEWFGPQGQFKQSNLGVICGKASHGLFFLDLDMQKENGAEQWYMELLANTDGRAFQTPTQQTGGGGIQILFRAPLDRIPSTCKTAIGVDVRGQGGFSVVPPSIHESGQNYRWCKGLAPWEVEIMEAPPWLLTELEALIVNHGGNKVVPLKTATPEVSVNAFNQMVDGREGYMAKLVWACVLDLYRQNPIMPSEDENRRAMRDAFSRYESSVQSRITESQTPNHILLEREGRGISEFQRKWAYAMRQWDGNIAMEASKPRQHQTQPTVVKFDSATGEVIEEDFASSSPSLYKLIDIPTLDSMPDPVWLIDNILLEQSFGLLYAMPGAGKSFLAIGMALAIATGQNQWFDKPIHRSGPVVYISSEGYMDMKFRIRAWSNYYQVDVNQAPFYLIPETVNFMSAVDVLKLIDTLKDLERRTAKPVLIVVDTVSRSLPGADENAQKDMTLFISACDAIREQMQSCVLGVHHTNKQGGMRGSTVLDGASDVILSVEREQGNMFGVLCCKKSKQAQDGWELRFDLHKQACGDVGGHESLVAAISYAAIPTESDWPSQNKQSIILDRLGEAWDEGKPWSMNHQSKLSGRHAITQMMKFDLSADLAQKVLEKWASNGIVSLEVRDSSKKVKGFKVLRRPASYYQIDTKND
jgi:AAA domain/Bifunctional DNA primase/polymerase, N-terminal